MKINKFISALSVVALFMASSCTKDALNKKTDIHLTVASTLDDYQKLLDGIEGGVINNAPGFFSYRSLGDYLSDDYYLTDNSYDNFFASDPFTTAVYKWDKDLFASIPNGLYEWDNQYKEVLYANVALDALKNISENATNKSEWDNIEGSAYFIRGQVFYNLAQLWAKPYQASSASSDLGIVLRLSSDPNPPSVRSTVAASYQQIVSDLTMAAALLPDISSQNTQISKIRPSKAAAYGMLARTYLAMGDYANVVKYSNLALQLYSTLLDYSALGTDKFYNLKNFNSEILYYSADQRGTIGRNFGFWNADQAVYNSYDSNDLRKTEWYNNSIFYGLLFVGDYSINFKFTGIGVDELYLLRAEGYARTGDTNSAMADLNTLLIKRYASGTYTARTAANAADALGQIITERRKELVGRGLRWTDLRRLNLEPRFAKTLTRALHGVTYTLPPNDSRYTLQIPEYVISAAKGSIVQNP